MSKTLSTGGLLSGREMSKGLCVAEKLSCFVLASTSCSASTFRSACHMVLVGGLHSEERGLRQLFSLAQPRSLAHTFHPGEEQAIGCPTKVLLPAGAEVSKRGTTVNRSAGRHSWSEDQNFHTHSFNLLTACEYIGFGENEETWNDQDKYA